MSDDSHKSKMTLSDDGSATFLLRWRGQQEGPYTATVIEAKLAANQIGMLHEVFRNSKWITLRTYLEERNAMERAQRTAIESYEQRMRAETDLQAKEREEKLRQAELAEANRGKSLAQASQSLSPTRPTDHLAKCYTILLKAICLVSLLAFFLPNVSISFPIVGKLDASMFDFFAFERDQSKDPHLKPQKPNVRNISDLQLSKLPVGGFICLVSLIGLLLHYFATLTWGILAFGFRKTFAWFNTVWLCLGLQFPILFSVGIHMALAAAKSDISQKSGSPDPDPDAFGTVLGLAFLNNTTISPGVVMWILMAGALVALGVNAFQQPSRT